MYFLRIEKVNFHQIVVSKSSIMRKLSKLNKSADFLVFDFLKLHFFFLLCDNVVEVPSLVVIVSY